MKKFHAFVFAGICFFSISSCNFSKTIKPIKEERIGFDIITATKMIETKEKLIVDLSLKKNITRSEFDILEKFFTKEFGEETKNVLYLFFDISEINNLDKDILNINQSTFYPTIFHKGINIRDAVTYEIFYESEFFNKTRLSILEEYTGNDKKLEGWQREYIFDMGENGEWEFSTFSGQVNFGGEGIDLQYLEFKK